MDAKDSTQAVRAKRQKIDKHGRSSAFAKLKQLKGNKHKYEVDELDSVYEDIDERDFCKKVKERQEDDWIIDDDGCGYVEDGREIFDDDLDSKTIERESKIKESGPQKKKNIKKGKGNIKNIFTGMSSKKESQPKLEDDNVLDDLMAELKNDSKDKAPKVVFKNKFLVSSTTQSPKSQVNELVDNSAIKKASLISSKRSKMINDSDDKCLIDRTEKPDFGTKDLITSHANQWVDISDEESPDDKDNKTSVVKVVPVLDTQPNDDEEMHDHVEDLSTVDSEDSNHSFSMKTENCEAEGRGNIKHTQLQTTDVEINNDMWDDDFVQQLTEITVSIDNTNLPLVTNDENEKIFRFFWWDAYEDPYKQPGVVYLFGKVYVETAQTYVACCVTVKNIDRRVYFLPREYIISEDGTKKPVTLMDVYEEFNEYANKHGIKRFRSLKVMKRYAFEAEDIPQVSDYLEVRYSAALPAIPATYSGPTIKHVFGSSINALELFLTERKIKGPCWLEVGSPLPVGNPVSWCKIEVECLNMENVAVSSVSQTMSPPPLVMATVNVRVTFNPKSQQNEVTMIAVMLHHKFHIDKTAPNPPFTKHFCLVTRPDTVPWPMHAKEALAKNTQTEVIYCERERNLLEELLLRVGKMDPDLFVVYDAGFQFEVLMHRMFDLSISNWSRIGKLKRSATPIFKGRVLLNQVFSGRLMCDIQMAAKELNLKLRSYDLPSLCVNVLKKTESECKELKAEDIPKYYINMEKIFGLLRTTLVEASYIVTIMLELNVMPLALQITCIAGNIMSRTLTAGRAERNEYLLLHAFHERGYITPDKRNTKINKTDKRDESISRRKKPAYTGGLVLEPKKGFYDTLILLMDFNSLYPSIIQEYNLCFTTVPGAAYTGNTEIDVPEQGLELGVIPTEIRKLVESRREVKKLMQSPNITPELKMQYNTRQTALKLTANSMYGCLGATHSRFYAKALAALVTAKGRDILLNTKDLVERLNFQVIYGDTDSIMINTNIINYDEVYAIGKKIKQEVNKLYKKVELDIDGVFRYLLLLQKKKYAAVTITKLPNGQLVTAQEYKGLDIVRRDWSQLACEIGRNVLDQLLCDQPLDTRLENIFDILQKVSKNLRDGNVPLSSLVITKQLSKNPIDYPHAKLPHVSVAMRLNAKGGRMWKVGDTVPYVICEDGTEKSAMDRAYHVDELKNSDTLKIDVNYYLMSQVLPIVQRICNPIDGLDDVLLAEHLGLHGIYKPKQCHHPDDVLPLLDEDIYRYCTRLKFACQNEKCQAEITMEAAFTQTASGMVPVLGNCSNVECDLAPWHYLPTIQNRLHLAIRAAINEYYAGWMECEDPICVNKTRRMHQYLYDAYPVCDVCEKCVMYRVYSETQLYDQLNFYLRMFDLSLPKYKNFLPLLSADVRNAYNILKDFVEKKLRVNAYSIINLCDIFVRADSHRKKIRNCRFFLTFLRPVATLWILICFTRYQLNIN